MTLSTVEDILCGYDKLIIYLVEELAFEGNINEAIGIATRHKITDVINEKTKELLKDLEYDESTDDSIRRYDWFGVLSKPK